MQNKPKWHLVVDMFKQFSFFDQDDIDNNSSTDSKFEMKNDELRQ